MERKSHWETVYRDKGAEEVSWYQPRSRRSLDWVCEAAPGPEAVILDAGGGASVLVDDLLAEDFRNLMVLDLSGAALARSQERLGALAAQARWIESDVLDVQLPEAGLDIWHDRAVFHFLTSEAEQQHYVAKVRHAVRMNGHVIVATFAEEGPQRCSGLEVQRYSPASLKAVFGDGFELLKSSREAHVTPAGKEQIFNYCLFRRIGPESSA